ncbi:Spc24 subunit of Ndc80-domain-containing protein [Delphinella strobiligena]|nr:Spc24 subunit of Ndc80-domain-containing protein [Delphinella strobiligena]
MVLFDEDPVTLIQQTTSNFHTSSDLSCLSRISSSISTLRSARSLRLQSATQSLSTLCRRAHHKSQELDSDISSHDPAAHASEILALDTEKFRVAKAASDLEIEGERLEGELRTLKRQLRVVEEQGDEGDERERGGEDENVLKLKVYRSLGIECEQDCSTGEVRRAVIRNGGDVNVVAIDPKFDRFFYAQHFWASL